MEYGVDTADPYTSILQAKEIADRLAGGQTELY